jgi:localization factor PodJL
MSRPGKLNALFTEGFESHSEAWQGGFGRLPDSRIGGVGGVPGASTNKAVREIARQDPFAARQDPFDGKMILSSETRRDHEWEAMAGLSYRLKELEARIAAPPAAGQGDNRLKGMWSELEAELQALARRRNAARRAYVPQAAGPALALEPPAPKNSVLSVEPEAARSRDTPLDSPSLADLKGEIVRLGGKLENMRRDAVRRDVLLRSEAARISDIERLRAEIADLAGFFSHLAPLTSHAGGDLEIKAEIRRLTTRLENLGKEGVDRAAFLRLQNQISEIHDLLRAAAALAECQARQQPSVAGENAGMQAQLEAMRGALDGGSRAGALEKIENRLETLAGMVGEAMAEARKSGQSSALAQQIETVHRQLAERIDAALAARSNEPPAFEGKGLEELLRALAAKLDAAPDIEALQSELAKIVERLDRADSNGISLADLQQSITNLFTQLDETRRAACHAADATARESVRQAMLGQNFGRNRSAEGKPAEGLGELSEFAELRACQEDAEHRHQLALGAIEETLEKLVERLTALEADCAELRPGPLGSLLASGIAPIFAPATQRRQDEPERQTQPGSGEGGAQYERHEPPRGLNQTLNPSLNPAWGRPVAPPFDRPLDQSAQRPYPRLAEANDILIEPGSGFPGSVRLEPGEQPSLPLLTDLEGRSGRADFIAAARRAALAAQPGAATPESEPASDAQDATRQAGLVGSLKRLLSLRKRPFVLGFAAFFLIASGYAWTKSIGQTQADDLAPPVSAEAGGQLQREGLPSNLPALTQAAGASVDPESAKMAVTGAIDDGPTPTGQGHSLLRDEAEAGNASAQYALALRFAEGHALEGELLPRDFKEAAQWYGKAAVQGLAPAQYRLASLYEKGLGVARDPAQAMFWYQHAAEMGNTRAMHNLAVLAAEGQGGRPDYATAVIWFGKAAEYGVRDSQFNLAILLTRGLGAPQNLIDAYRWFAIAASQGDEDARRKRDDVGQRLAVADLAVARAAAKGFQPRVADPAANEVAVPTGWDAAPGQERTQKPKVSAAQLP